MLRLDLGHGSDGGGVLEASGASGKGIGPRAAQRAELPVQPLARRAQAAHAVVPLRP
jgi:hypothetical protein